VARQRKAMIIILQSPLDGDMTSGSVAKRKNWVFQLFC